MGGMITPTSPLLGAATHTPDRVYAYAERHGADRLPFLKVYLNVLYDLCNRTGINGDLAAIQGLHETDVWTSDLWKETGNPAGLGVPQNAPSEGLVFATGTQAARAHVAHLLLYATGAIDRGGLTTADDGRYDDYVALFGHAPRATTLHGLAGSWAEDLSYDVEIAARAAAVFGADMPETITFGRVPHPSYVDRPITKAAGFGQDNLGKRSVKGIVLHRMLGTLWGTDGYFRMDNVAALTDYGVGVLDTDGSDNDGVILRFNDPLGYQSGWASGTVNAPYGDGLAFVNKYGINAVNRDEASVEISGNYDTAFSEKAKNAVAGVIAYWADQYKIPYADFPISTDGFSFIRWHQEFTIGTGKICPGQVVMDATNDLIERARVIMKRYQVSEATPTVPTYATPGPIPPVDGTDQSLHNQVWYACARQVKVKKTVKRLATVGGHEAAAPLKPGDSFHAVFAIRSGAHWHWITKEGYRIAMDATGPKVIFV